MGRRTKSDPIDWPAVEKEYRLGQISLRQMSGLFRLHPSTISRRARNEGWTRDAGHEVRKQSVLYLAQVSGLNATANATPSSVEVEAAAVVRANTLLAHRRDIAHVRRLVMSLLEEWDKELPPVSPVPIKWLAARARMLKSLVTTFARLIGLEREAFGLATDAGSDRRPIAIIKDYTGRGDPDSPSLHGRG